MSDIVSKPGKTAASKSNFVSSAETKIDHYQHLFAWSHESYTTSSKTTWVAQQLKIDMAFVRAHVVLGKILMRASS